MKTVSSCLEHRSLARRVSRRMNDAQQCIGAIGHIACIALITAFASCSTTPGSDEPDALPAYDMPGSFSVATVIFYDLVDADRENRRVPIKVHFPSDSGRFPLVVISHGGGGTWDSHLYQARHLASHGYVVACLEHVYSNAERMKYYMNAGGGMTMWDALRRIMKDPRAVLERPKDVRFAIDQMLRWNAAHEQLEGKIDSGRIAVMGHSFGAYTTLVVCGAQPVLDYLDPVVPPGSGLAGDLSDPRVSFGLAMSPQSPGTVYFGTNSYRTINRPLVCLSGSEDTQWDYKGAPMPPATRWQVLELLPPGEKYFVWLDRADHFSFSDGPGASLFPSASRPDVQRISKALMVLFCDYFLKGKREARAYMNGEYVNTLLGDVVTGVQWKEK